MQVSEQEKVYWNNLRQGDNEGLYGLYRLLYTYLYHYGITLTPDDALVKDAIQNIFLYFWEKRHTLAPVQYVRGYILKAFRRSLLESMKKNNHRLSIEVDVLDEGDMGVEESMEDTMIKGQENQRLVDQLIHAIKKLPARQRELIYLKYYQNLSYEEIAHKTDTSIRTVYNQIHSAVKTLRKNKNLTLDNDSLLGILLYFAIWKSTN